MSRNYIHCLLALLLYPLQLLAAPLELDTGKALPLTQEQRQWLDTHPDIRLAIDIDWPPFEWIDEDNHYVGMAADYIHLVEQKLGIHFEVEKNKPWPEVMEAFKRGELDVFSCIAESEKRKEFANFTRAYLDFPMVMITRDNISFLSGIDSLRGLRVGVVEGYLTHEYLQANHPELDVYLSKSSYQGLQSVSHGSIDVFIGNIATLGYIAQKEGMTNIKVSGEMPVHYELSMAVRKDWPILVDILQLALDDITQQQRHKINSKWVEVKYNIGFDYTLLWQTLGIFAAILALLYFHNRKLSHEIDRRKTAESDLLMLNQSLVRAKEYADRANIAKSEFLSRMSHELRTPLNAILGFGQILDMDLKDKHAKENVQEILGAGNHLLTLINDILDLSRIEAGKLTLSMEHVHLNHVLEECFSLIKPLAKTYDINIIDHVSTATDHVVYADYTSLKQTLINLLSNAVKYNRVRGSITLDAEIVSPQSLRVSVSDTGMGLTEEQQQQLFKPFERITASRSKVEGTGIGLVITRHLVEQMGGRIGFDSEPGKGTTFWIELGLDKDDEEQALQSSRALKQEQQVEVVQQAATIVYIEDNPANVKLVQELISSRTKHTLYTAPDATRGLMLISTHRPGLVLLDINLPGMDGFEVMEKLQSADETRDIPVIAISAYAMQGDIERGLAAGFREYITKPIDVDVLLDIINSTLSTSSSQH